MNLEESNLGIYYYNGYGVAQSETEAFFWFSLAAAQGDADASQSRNIIASHLSHTAIAESQKRVASFIASKDSATQADGDAATATTLLNQLVSWPLSEQINQNGEMPSREDDTGMTRPAIGHDCFTVGSTKNDVLAIQGEPTTFNDSYLTYGMSMVMFQDGKVINWNSADVKLKAKYLTATNLIPKEYFTVGSTREDVLAIHGEPTTFSDSYLTYGMSMVMFQNGKVVNWNNMDVKLKAQYTTTSNLMVAQRSQDAITNPVPAQSSIEPNELSALAQRPPQSNPSPAHAADPRLTKEDIAYLKSQGIDPTTVTVQDTPQPQVHGIAFMDSFLGTTNFCVPSDNVISMKTDALKFQINGTTYDYSGHYAVMLTTPRKHRNPSFGFGTPDKAKLIIIDDFGGETMPLPDATIWEKSKGFIDVEALGKEWIYSGTYTIQQ